MGNEYKKSPVLLQILNFYIFIFAILNNSKIFYLETNLQPDLNGNPFFGRPKALAKKRLGVEGGLSCPNKTLIN